MHFKSDNMVERYLQFPEEISKNEELMKLINSVFSKNKFYMG